MKRIVALFAVLVVAVFVLNGYMTQASNQDRFWAEAAQGGMAEVALANLALQKSQNEQVKAFAQKVVDDHTMANNELKALAAGKNVTLPMEVTAKQTAMMDKLSGKSGADFDKEFIKTMVKDHEKMIKLFERQAESGTDADVKAFATKTLPTLRSHLEMARTMSAGMKNMSRNSNTDDNRYSDKTPNVNPNANMNSNMMNSNRNMNSSRDMMDSDQNMNSSSNMRMNSNGNMMMNSNMMRNSNMMMNSNINPNMNSNRNMNSNMNSNDNMNSNGNVNDNVSIYRF